MKIIFKICFIISSIILAFFMSSVSLSASDANSPILIDSNSGLFKSSADYMYIAALDNPEINIHSCFISLKIS